MASPQHSWGTRWRLACKSSLYKRSTSATTYCSKRNWFSGSLHWNSSVFDNPASCQARKSQQRFSSRSADSTHEWPFRCTMWSTLRWGCKWCQWPPFCATYTRQSCSDWSLSALNLCWPPITDLDPNAGLGSKVIALYLCFRDHLHFSCQLVYLCRSSDYSSNLS